MVVYDDELANAEVWNGGGMNTTDSQFEKPWDQPATFWRAPIRFLFGYDIFISYARSDAEIYAELLETKLEALAYQPRPGRLFVHTAEIDARKPTCLRPVFRQLDQPLVRLAIEAASTGRGILDGCAGREQNLLAAVPNPQQPDWPYSPRRAWIGSTDAARRAGNADAARAKAKTVIAVRTTTTGSKGLT